MIFPVSTYVGANFQYWVEADLVLHRDSPLIHINQFVYRGWTCVSSTGCGILMRTNGLIIGLKLEVSGGRSDGQEFQEG